MSNLYAQGFSNKDDGLSYGLFLDDSDYFVFMETRRIDKQNPELYNNEHFKEPRLLNSKKDIVTRFLSARLRKEISESKDGIEGLSEKQKDESKDELARVIAKFFGEER